MNCVITIPAMQPIMDAEELTNFAKQLNREIDKILNRPLPKTSAAFNAAPERSKKPCRGDVVGYLVVDAETGEWVLRCLSRSEARSIGKASNGRVARVVVE